MANKELKLKQFETKSTLSNPLSLKMIIIFNLPTHFRFKAEIIIFLQFFFNFYRGAGYKTLLLAVYKTSIFFGGSEVAGYKTSIFFEVPKWLFLKPPVIHFKVFLKFFFSENTNFLVLKHVFGSYTPGDQHLQHSANPLIKSFCSERPIRRMEEGGATRYIFNNDILKVIFENEIFLTFSRIIFLNCIKTSLFNSTD